MFVDHIRVHAKAGRGGDGSASFRREKFVPKGGPDGGDGGKGGDIVLEASVQEDHLIDFFYQPNLVAKDGKAGRGRQMTGRSGSDVVFKVPVGTLVYRLAPDESREGAVPKTGGGRGGRPDDAELLADLNHPGERFVLCRGGAGGKGNVHFKSSRNQTPRQFTEGGEGEEGWFFLEVRTMADVGLVGYPNAGKSTLLGAISAAHPKTAAYPFTTLTPTVGVIEYPDLSRLTVADIPGLMEGAHRNVGLGHEFLRHIMRCGVLLMVIDMAGSEGREPVADLETLRRELSMYDKSLAAREWLVAANKMDLENAEENLRNFRNRFPGVEVIPIAAKEGRGIEDLLQRLKSSVALASSQ